MSVVIRRSGYAWTWICKIPVKQPDGKKKPCNYTSVVDFEADARTAYEAHKKTAKGH